MKEDKIFSRQAQKITDGKYDLFFETNGKVEDFRKRKKRIFIAMMNVTEDGKMEQQAQCIRLKTGKARRRDRFDSNLFAGKSDWYGHKKII